MGLALNKTFDFASIYIFVIFFYLESGTQCLLTGSPTVRGMYLTLVWFSFVGLNNAQTLTQPLDKNYCRGGYRGGAGRQLHPP